MAAVLASLSFAQVQGLHAESHRTSRVCLVKQSARFLPPHKHQHLHKLGIATQLQHSCDQTRGHTTTLPL